MDIWSWVNTKRLDLISAGQDRLAQLVAEVPSAVCDNEHARVDAIIPEGVAMSRALDEPWLELFFRHWALQSKVLRRGDATCLPEAVELLELASRDRYADCPQAVCVTQDLTGCYAFADGPGYVEERLAASRETLSRIDPGWPCFNCIASEHASALFDAERWDDALRWVEECDGKSLASGNASNALVEERTRALLMLGRAAEAWEVISDYERPASGEGGAMGIRLLRVATLLALGRTDDAAEHMPRMESIRDTPRHYRDWVDNLLALIERGAAPNDWETGAALRQMTQQLEANQARFLAASVARDSAILAARRSARKVAELHLAEARRLGAALRKPEALHLERAERAVAECQPSKPSGDEADPEMLLERVGAAADETALSQRAQALAALGFERLAIAELEAFVSGDPQSPGATILLAECLLAAGEHDRLDALDASDVPERARPAVCWLRSISLELRGELERARATLERLVELDPDSPEPRVRLAELHRRSGDLERALALLDDVVGTAEPGPADWDRMVVATQLGRWQAVRHSARRVGMELEEGDEPIDEAWAICRLRFADGQGALHALRTGPVTARVLEIAGPGRDEHYGDHVVFEAVPLGDVEPDSDEPLEYRVLDVVAPGNHQSFALDGVHPGEERLEALRELVQSWDGGFEVLSGDGYELIGPDGREHVGLYAYFTVPRAGTPKHASLALLALTSEWPEPLIWRELARAAGHTDEHARQERIADEWQLDD